MKRFFSLLVPCLWLLSACNLFGNYGKKITFGDSEVYYKGEGVTEAQAQKLGDFLKEQEYFDGKNAKSVQLTKDGDDYMVHFVVDQKKMTEAARLNFWKLQYDISKEVFNGKPARVALTNEKLEDQEVLDPIADYKIGKSNLYYDNAEIKKGEAKKLADFFTEVKLLGEDKESDVFFQKDEGQPVVRVVVNPKKVDSEVLPVFSYWQEQMREKVFGGKKAKMILTATTYEDLKPLPKLTAEERQKFEAETTQTDNQTTETSIDSTTQSTSGVLRLPNN